MATVAIFLVLSGLAVPTLAADRFHPTGPEDSLVRFLQSHGYENSDEPSVLPSEVFTSLPDEASRRALVRELLRGVAGHFPASALARVLQASFGWSPGEGDVQALAQLDDAMLDRIAGTLLSDLGIAHDPRRLDRFPTVPLDGIPAVQSALFSMGEATPRPKPPIAFPVSGLGGEDWRKVGLGTSHCTLPAQYDLSPVYPQFGIYSGEQTVQRERVACYAQNSIALARLLNGLSNTVAGMPAMATLGWKGGDTFPVASFADLADAFTGLGLTVEIYSGRVPVDFLGWWFRTASGYRSIRIATWIQARLPEGTFSFPGEHGELDLIVRLPSGKRIAGLRWFMGVPDASEPQTAVYWRPHLELPVSWSQVLNELVVVLPPGQTAAAVPYWKAAANAMRGFQAIEDRYHPPLNGYGLFICSDSLAWLLSSFDGSPQGWGPARPTNAFPLIYATEVPRVSAQGTRLVAVDRIFERYSGIDLSALERVAPADPRLQADPTALQTRLQDAFRPQDDNRWGAFADFRQSGLAELRGFVTKK